MTKISCLLLLAAIILFVLMMELGNKHLSHALAYFVLTGTIVEVILITGGITCSVIALCKEKTILSGICLFFFFIPVVVIICNLTGFHPKIKAKSIAEKQLISEYKEISGQQALCVLRKGGMTVFLLAIAKDEKSYKNIGNGDFYIQYEQSLVSLSIKQEIRSVECAHFIPEQNNRYLVKTRKIGDTEPDEEWNEWEDQGYADESAEYKKLLEYYLSHKSKISVLK
ncbi:hypothetical protein FACS189432_06610 [Bacteroidia bacterium]|nr:hypothetical protein FACS189426_12880 [Bacteroidia bacterium]GHT28532.1 hypothetical protein FACS189432_06610 [Bacteroidia bacterium]